MRPVLYFYTTHYTRPLSKDLEFPGFQMATIQGNIRNCGDFDFPSLAVRLDDPRVLCFIRSVTGDKKDVNEYGENFCVTLKVIWFIYEVDKMTLRVSPANVPLHSWVASKPDVIKC